MSSNACTKRLMQELMQLRSEPSSEFTASPLESDILEWHFTIRGAANTPFQGGKYHGRLIFPPDYPFKPPNIVFLTENGRFQVGKKICLSITGYHPESWMPAWGVRTALTALITFMSTPGEGSVGAIEWSDEQRKLGAKKSIGYVCNVCGSRNIDALPSEEQVPSVEIKSELILNPTEAKSSDIELLDDEMIAAMKESARVKDQDERNFSAGTSSSKPTDTQSDAAVSENGAKSDAPTPKVGTSPDQSTPNSTNSASQNPWLWSVDLLIIAVFGILIALLLNISSRK